jgi:uncharacterized membrane protein
MSNYLKCLDEYLTFDADDKKLWIYVGGALGLIVLLFSIFTTSSVFYYLKHAITTVMVIFMPGYLITKLFLDKISFSDNRVADKIIISFTISVVVMVLPYFSLTYLRPYDLNTDEEGLEPISRDHEVMLLLLLVIVIAFGVKYYMNKKNKAATGGE